MTEEQTPEEKKDETWKGFLAPSQTVTEREWKDMPEFKSESKEEYAQIVFHFNKKEDLAEFSRLIGQDLNSRPLWAWFPRKSATVKEFCAFSVTRLLCSDGEQPKEEDKNGI